MRNGRTSSPDMPHGKLLVMNSVHRVEILYHGSTERFEYWQDQTASVRFFRRRTANDWVATIDGALVMDVSSEDHRSVRTISMKPLRAGSVEELVPLVAMRELVHGILVPTESGIREGDALGMEATELGFEASSCSDPDFNGLN